MQVTLMLTSDANQIVSGNELNQMSGGVSGALNPITEFYDLVPNNYLPSMPTTKVQMVQGETIKFKFALKSHYVIYSNHHRSSEAAS